jgi:hypothetical protein
MEGQEYEGMDSNMGMDQAQIEKLHMQQQMQMQQYGAMEMQMENQQKNYFDSIETDEFVMPTKFEVEIRM